ncbi:MAG TPA: hypothetical protein VG205_14035 [Acidimicrobiales bacterium]|nr:hypothetical protein [Acidimicrobiales bacterium]
MTATVTAGPEHRPVRASEPTGPRPGRLSTRWGLTPTRWALVLVCVALPVLEAALVLVLIPGSSPALAPQVTAVAPFGLFHDLRWLSVYGGSWPTFGALGAGILIVRGALTGVSVRLAWPPTATPPSLVKLMIRGAGATTLAAVFLAPSVALLFALAVVPVSWLFLAAVPLALGVALVVHPVAVNGGWWKRAIPLRAVGWVALSFLAMTVAAAVIAAAPRWGAIPVAGVAGIFNARAWVGMVGAVVQPRHPHHHAIPAVPVALAAMAVIVAVGSVNGFTHVSPQSTGSGERTAFSPPVAGEQAVLVVSGYGSHWDGSPDHPVPGQFFEERFSYRGLRPSGQPIPYASTDTVQPLKALDAQMAVQVAYLHRATGRPVDIVAESEGALVAKSYLISVPRPPVGNLVMASPLLAPGRVSYPVGDASESLGLPARDALQLLGNAYRSVAPINLSPDSPFLQSVDQLAPLLQQLLSCPSPGVRQVALLPLADATAAPPHLALPFPSVVVPAFHGGLIGNSSTDGLIADALRGQVPAGNVGLRDLDNLIAASASAWQTPSLALSSYARTIPAHPSSESSCQALATALRS